MSSGELFKEYYYSLGRFIDSFSSVERSLYTLLRYESRVHGEVAAALLRGFNVDAIKDAVKRIRSARGLGEDVLMERMFAQITIISSKRNDIVHFGAEYSGGNFTVSNAMKAHNEQSTRTFSASPTVLEELSEDLDTILAGLAACIFEAASRDNQVTVDGNREEAMARLRERADVPWRYTPPQPSPRQKQNPQTHPKRQRPPRASRRLQQAVPKEPQP